MKVDIGESIMLSWLRHEKNCQLVQLNWKPSINSWDLYNEKAIEYIMKETSRYFSEKYELDLFKKSSSFLQVIQQGEIDALGTEIKDGIRNIYGIDIAFHENGLQYGSKEQTVANVLKKLVRTSMIIYGFFNVNKANIIFASPKVHKAKAELLKKGIEELNQIFDKLNLSFNFSLVINDDFKEEIFEKVLSYQDSISDTSELFMRSMQLYKLFGRNYEGNGYSQVKEQTHSTGEEKIGNLVRSQVKELIAKGLITDREIDRLKQSKYSKEIFGLNYEFFREIEDDETIHKYRVIKGYSRYYSKPYYIKGRKFILCNQWFERNRKDFNAWVRNLKLLHSE